MTQPVVHNEAAGRFELRVQGHLCVAQYHLIDGVMWLTHTEVSPQIAGAIKAVPGVVDVQLL